MSRYRTPVTPEGGSWIQDSLEKTHRRHLRRDLPVFQEKQSRFPAPEGTPLFSAHSGILAGIGSRDWLADWPVFAHFLTLLYCTVFSRL